MISAEIHSTSLLLLVCAAIMLLGGILLAYIPRFPAAVMTYCSLWLLRLSGMADISDRIILNWGIATAAVILLTLILPRTIARARQGVMHIATSTLAGAAVGAVAATITSIIAGAVVGALLGCFAYSRTTAGRELARSGSRFINYTLAKALPAIVNFAMTGIFIAYIL